MPLGRLTPQPEEALPPGYRRNPRNPWLNELEEIPAPPRPLPGMQGTDASGNPTSVNQPAAPPVNPAMASLTGRSGPSSGPTGTGEQSGPSPADLARQGELDRQASERDRLDRQGADADRTERAGEEANRVKGADADRAASADVEANRVRQAEADRLAKAGASQAEIAARMAELEREAALKEASAVTASGRASADRDKLLGQIPGIMSSLTGGGGTGGAPAAGTVDPAAAREATFARAKDKIGQIQRASLTSLREGMAERGTLGGGLEQGAMASLMGEGQEQLGDVVRDQTISDLDRENSVADRNYNADVTRRGQNLSLSQSLLSLLGRAY